MDLSELQREIKFNYSDRRSDEQIRNDVFAFIKECLKSDNLFEEYKDLFDKLKESRSKGGMKELFTKMLLSQNDLLNYRPDGSRTIYIRPLTTSQNKEELYIFNIYFAQFLASLLSGEYALKRVLESTIPNHITFPYNSIFFPLLQDQKTLSNEDLCELFLSFETPQPYIPIKEIMIIQSPHKKSNLKENPLFFRITLPDYLHRYKDHKLIDALPLKRLEKAKNEFFTNLYILANTHPLLKRVLTSYQFEFAKSSQNTNPIENSFGANANKQLTLKSTTNEESIISQIISFDKKILEYIAIDNSRMETEDRIIKIAHEFSNNLSLWLKTLNLNPELCNPEELENKLVTYLKSLERFHYSNASYFIKLAEGSTAPIVQRIYKELSKDKFWKKLKK